MQKSIQEVILDKAVQFEIEAVNGSDTNTRNPYYDIIHSWPDGDIYWLWVYYSVEVYFTNLK